MKRAAITVVLVATVLSAIALGRTMQDGSSSQVKWHGIRGKHVRFDPDRVAEAQERLARNVRFDLPRESRPDVSVSRINTPNLPSCRMSGRRTVRISPPLPRQLLGRTFVFLRAADMEKFRTGKRTVAVVFNRTADTRLADYGCTVLPGSRELAQRLGVKCLPSTLFVRDVNHVDLSSGRIDPR